MHGIINRAFQCFIRDTYGQSIWNDIADSVGVPGRQFEALQDYHDTLSEAMLDYSGQVLEKPRAALLEDFGTYLVSHPTTESLRRLMRFSGASFPEFLQSLDEMPDRARLAVPDLTLPQFQLQDNDRGSYCLICRSTFSGAGHVLVGVLRTMADDYGALAVLEHLGSNDNEEIITIELLDHAFTAGREFKLAVSTSA